MENTGVNVALTPEQAAAGLVKETAKQKRDRLKKEKEALQPPPPAPEAPARLVTQADIDAAPDAGLVLGQPMPVAELPLPKRFATQQILDLNPEKGYTLGQEIPEDDEVIEPADDAAEEEHEESEEHDEETNIFDAEEFTDEMLEDAVTRPDVVEVARRIVTRADAMARTLGSHITEELSDEEKAIRIHESLVQTHGKDYVQAKRTRDGATTVFKRSQWETLPKSKNGWVELERTLPELGQE